MGSLDDGLLLIAAGQVRHYYNDDEASTVSAMNSRHSPCFLVYIKLPRLSVCLSVFRISQKLRTDFHETFHGS